MKDNSLRLEKLKKRESLLKYKVDPYPHDWRNPSWEKKARLSDSLTVNQRADEFSVGEFSKDRFYIAGRLMRKRDMGKAAFFNLQDEKGQVQCYIRKDTFYSKNSNPLTAKKALEASANKATFETKPNPETKPALEPHLQESIKTRYTYKSGVEIKPVLEPYLQESNNFLKAWDLWKLCDIGDILSVQGVLFKTKKGEPSLRVQDLKILCKSVEPLPEKYHGIENIELKYRLRHLDLIMDQKSKEIFKIRSQVIKETRNFMDKQGFIEFETPVLQAMYGGAVAEPFETHFRRLDYQKMYLKISPELYLKKLIVGGFEKIYEIGKNFRNEGIDRTHNPEFTMMEYYQAYTDYEDQMQLFKNLVNHLVKKINKNKKRDSNDESKPDSLKKQDQDKKRDSNDESNPDYLKIHYQGKEIDFNQWETLPIKTALKKYSSLDKLEPKDQEFLKKALGKDYQSLDPDKLSCSDLLKAIKHLDPSGDYRKYEQQASVSPQPVSLQKSELPPDPVSAQQAAVSSQQSSNPPDPSFPRSSSFPRKRESRTDLEENLKGELIVKAFELLVEKHLWNPTFITDFPLSVSPLTKQHRKDKTLVERFEPYIAGMELGNAYTELNDPIDQKERLLQQNRYQQSQVNAPRKEKLDKTFIHALEVGMPPTGGVGLGIERLVMILADQKSIRDCILFPALKSKD